MRSVLAIFLAAGCLFAGGAGMKAGGEGYYQGADKAGLRTTYYINYKRIFYRVNDTYYDYNRSDLAVDYRKQMEREEKLKDTL